MQTLRVSAPLFLQKLHALTTQEYIHPDSRIVFVDDGSCDQTWETISALHKQYKEIFGLRLRKNVGEQDALLTGMQWAVDKADCLVSMDSDLQDDIDCVDEMVRQYLSGAAVVLGVRSSRTQDTRMERLTSSLFYFVMQKMHTGLVPQHSSFRLMRRDAVRQILERDKPFYLPCAAGELDLPTTTILYARKARAAGTSAYTFLKRFRLGLYAVASHSAIRKWVRPHPIEHDMICCVLSDDSDRF